MKKSVFVVAGVIVVALAFNYSKKYGALLLVALVLSMLLVAKRKGQLTEATS